MDIVRNSFLRPTLKLDDQKFEFIFLLDTSISMSGSRLELAKASLKLILHSLPATCYFNIITFNSTFHPFFVKSVRYSQTSLLEAKTILAGVKVAAGTKLLEPLKYVYNRPQIPGYLTQIFSITDGCVSNRREVLKLVASKTKHSRSFCLGIGSKVDRKLVIGIAKNAGGIHEFVTQGEIFETKILNQLKIALKPALLKPIRVTTASRMTLDGFCDISSNSQMTKR